MIANPILVKLHQQHLNLSRKITIKTSEVNLFERCSEGRSYTAIFPSAKFCIPQKNFFNRPKVSMPMIFSPIKPFQNIGELFSLLRSKFFVRFLSVCVCQYLNKIRTSCNSIKEYYHRYPYVSLTI